MCMCVGAHLKGQQAESCRTVEGWASCVQAQDSCTPSQAREYATAEADVMQTRGSGGLCSESALGQAALAASMPRAEASCAGQNMSLTSFCQ